MAAEKIADSTRTIYPRSWGVRVLVGAGCLLFLVWCAPLILGLSPFVSFACDQAKDYLDGRVTVSSVSLGWFSPIVLYNVELHDRDDRTIAKAEKVVGDRTLISLLLNHEDLGSFHIEHPTIDWTFEGLESNLERVFARALQPAGDRSHGPAPDSALPRLHLEITDGTLSVNDKDTKGAWKASALAMSVLVFNDPAKTVQVSMQGALHDGTEAGSFKADVHLENVTDPNPKATIKGRFSSFPLAMSGVFFRRFEPGTRVEGSLQGHCHLALSVNMGKAFVDLSGEVIANNVTVHSPALKEDLHLERVTVPCRIKLDDQVLAVEQIEIDCDLGRAAAHGSLDLSRGWLAGLDQPNCDFSVDLSLPALVERLPKTLKVHEDLRLTTGQLGIAGKSEATGSGIIWRGKVRTTDVRGIKGKKTIAWSEPIQVDLQARNFGKGVPLLDQLHCNARFLKMEAASGADQFTLLAEADLKELIEPLGEFIAIDSLSVGGNAKVSLTIRRPDQDAFDLRGDAQFKQINLSWFTREPWKEDSVVAHFDARGNVDPTGRQHVARASLDVKLGGDTGHVQLIEPISDLGAGPFATFAIGMEGDLARWQERSLGWTRALAGWQLAGQGSLELKVKPSADAVDCSSALLLATNFQLLGSGLSVQEPTLSFQTSGRWDTRTGSLDLGPTKLSCPTLFAESARLTSDSVTKVLRGTVEVTGNLARLRQWHEASRKQASTPVQAILAGRLDLESKGGSVQADADLTLKNLVYGDPTNPAWQEPEVRCTGRAVYEPTADSFRMENLRLTSATGTAGASGKIEHLTSTMDIAMAGTLMYDLQKMEPQLRPLLGKDVRIAGTGSRPFRLEGPLYPESKGSVAVLTVSSPGLSPPPMHYTDLRGEASMNWHTLHALGCDAGSAEVKAVLQRGWFQLYPISTTLNGGKLFLQPNVRLEPGPTEMVLLAGPVIEKARLTTEMCAGAMAYAMPLLANVTDADGLFSLNLEGGRIPLSAPATGEIKGTFVVHSAKLETNAILRELTAVMKLQAPTGYVKDCPVPFHMINGKVHHRDLVLEFPDFTVRSSGAVGLDGTLAIVLEMPIPPALAAAAKLTPAQARELIRIPVGGTVDRPRLDPRALESVTSTLGRSVIENQLNRFLQPGP